MSPLETALACTLKTLTQSMYSGAAHSALTMYIQKCTTIDRPTKQHTINTAWITPVAEVVVEVW